MSLAIGGAAQKIKYIVQKIVVWPIKTLTGDTTLASSQ